MDALSQDVVDCLRSHEYSGNEFLAWASCHLQQQDQFSPSDAEKYIEWRRSLNELLIDESNFDQYFFDVRKHRPLPGQVLACYECEAELIDGNLKRDIIHLLLTNDRAGDSTVRLMQKLAGATAESASSAIQLICRDLLSGMSTEQVARKPYSFFCQVFFYTYKECIPQHDPHWWSTTLVDIKTFCEDSCTEDSRIVLSELEAC